MHKVQKVTPLVPAPIPPNKKQKTKHCSACQLSHLICLQVHQYKNLFLNPSGSVGDTEWKYIPSRNKSIARNLRVIRRACYSQRKLSLMDSFFVGHDLDATTDFSVLELPRIYRNYPTWSINCPITHPGWLECSGRCIVIESLLKLSLVTLVLF